MDGRFQLFSLPVKSNNEAVGSENNRSGKAFSITDMK